MYLSEANFDFNGKTVLLRIDTDVDIKEKNGKIVVDEDYRLKSCLPTIRYLQENGVGKIIMTGHMGRPEGKFLSELSLAPVADWFSRQLKDCRLVDLRNASKQNLTSLSLLENLRFYPGEENNDQRFCQKLAALADVYVNEAFGVSHRDNGSITGIANLLPSFLGLRFEGEVRALSWLRKKAARPLVFILGGSKKGKVDYISFLSDWADKTLIGGMIPTRIKDLGVKIDFSRVMVGELNKSGRDISKKTIDDFEQVIRTAKTVVWAGPMGVYEEAENRKGTEEIGRIISESKTFKIAGGGDTHRALSWNGLWKKFDFVSVGGGAMLEFLKKGTLIGMIEKD